MVYPQPHLTRRRHVDLCRQSAGLCRGRAPR
ncbi:putative leader peptide [Streptomyces sp. NPDC007088]